MKTIIILFYTLLLFISFSVKSQTFFLKDSSSKEIVAKLFEAKWNKKDSTFQWMPNFSESIQFGSNYKDTLRTKVDTIFDYMEENILKKVIVTSTYINYDDCHSCQPSLGIINLSLNEELNVFQVDNIAKYIQGFGAWGKSPKKISLFQTNNSSYCVNIIEEFNAFGVETHSTSLFSKGKCIYSFINFKSNVGAVEFKKDEYLFSTKISFDPKINKIKIIKKGTDLNSNGKVIKVNLIFTYEFDPLNNYLERKSTINVYK